ncbi:MAG: PglZ domain-containing protein, partial [Bacteroidales bacterium]|nr:PglZ domain-containing protein [Bacteroidales bacterium]
RYVVSEGKWFTYKHLLDTEWKDEKVIFYFDISSPLDDKEAKEAFPLLDVLVANKVYHNEDYMSFIQQYNLPQSMTVFVRENVRLLQSSGMLAILGPAYADGSVTVDVAERGILSSFLSARSVLSWEDIMIRVLLLAGESERGKHRDFHKKLQTSQMTLTALDKHFSDIFGVGLDLKSEAKVEEIVQSFKYNAIVYNIAPAPADNYKRFRLNNDSQLKRLNIMLECILADPKYAPAFEELLNELGSKIHCDNLSLWYGADAKFQYMPSDLFEIVLKNLLSADMANEYERVLTREGELKNLNHDKGKFGSVLEFVAYVAHYYEMESSMRGARLRTPDDYVAFYESSFYRLDQLYRMSVEVYNKIDPAGGLHEKAQPVKKSLDLHYAETANVFNLDWTDCVRVAGGFSGLTRLRQWEFYEKKLRSLQKKAAVIISDGLRYEMAVQLIDKFANSRHTAELGSFIATLPTETKFCKPSLFPHGELELDETKVDMTVDGRILGSLAQRTAHLQTYKADALCVQFSDIAQYDIDKNRDVFKRPLVYIFHNGIDESGHNSEVSKQIVGACSQAIDDLATMVTKILASYNVTEVYVTSDHGFLFNDMEFEDKDKVQVTEECLEQKSRYYLTRSDTPLRGIVKYPLSEVSGMTGADGVMVAVPEGTNRFAAPSGGYVYTHGGASLQEMVVPVVVCRQKRTDVKEPVEVAVLEQRLSVMSSRLRFTLLQTKAVDMDNRGRTVSVALYHDDLPVTQESLVVLDKTDSVLDNRKIMVDLTLNKNVDAKVLELKVYDVDDRNNPLLTKDVTNNTLIENDFDF